MIEAAGDSQTRVVHGAPVENLQGNSTARAKEKQTLFFALSSPSSSN
jgi:hypothetical protein